MSDVPENEDESEIEVLTLPLDAWHRARGGRMVEFAGYWMPVQYEGIMAEHAWTRESAGLFDVSHMGQLFVSGEGVEPALEAVLPIDLATLKPYGPRYSMLLDENGGMPGSAARATPARTASKSPSRPRTRPRLPT